jgi:hypothetical protein
MKRKFENFLKQLGDSQKRKGIFQLMRCFAERSEAKYARGLSGESPNRIRFVI